MSRLRSRHIVAYVESGMSGTRDIFWIVMELLEVNTRTHNSVCRCSNSLMFSPLACALYRHATQMADGFILWNLLSAQCRRTGQKDHLRWQRHMACLQITCMERNISFPAKKIQSCYLGVHIHSTVSFVG